MNFVTPGHLNITLFFAWAQKKTCKNKVFMYNYENVKKKHSFDCTTGLKIDILAILLIFYVFCYPGTP